MIIANPPVFQDPCPLAVYVCASRMDSAQDVDAIQVHIVEARLRRGDMVIVASDGVGHVLRPSFVVPLTKGLNSDSVVKEIIQEAQLKVNEYDDDKSMVVLRVVG